MPDLRQVFGLQLLGGAKHVLKALAQHGGDRRPHPYLGPESQAVRLIRAALDEGQDLNGLALLGDREPDLLEAFLRVAEARRAASSAFADKSATTPSPAVRSTPRPSTGASFPPDDLTPATPDEIRAFFANRR